MFATRTGTVPALRKLLTIGLSLVTQAVVSWADRPQERAGAATSRHPAGSLTSLRTSLLRSRFRSCEPAADCVRGNAEICGGLFVGHALEAAEDHGRSVDAGQSFDLLMKGEHPLRRFNRGRDHEGPSCCGGQFALSLTRGRSPHLPLAKSQRRKASCPATCPSSATLLFVKGPGKSPGTHLPHCEDHEEWSGIP